LKATERAGTSAMVPGMKSLCFVRSMVCSKYERILEGVWSSQHVEQSSEHWQATQRWGWVKGYAGEKMSDKIKILLIDVPCECVNTVVC